MQNKAEFTVADAIGEIAALFATAYRRYAKVRAADKVSQVLSSKELAIPGRESVRELTLTRQREESPTK